jgi:putative Mg2+ transporter-C (MgtC) family protein
MFDNLIDLSQFNIFLDVLIASGLTMLVGIEREKSNKAAGLRTNMIVGGFTCLIVSLGNPLINLIESQNISEIINSDPIRIFEAIVVGISFLGAGTILKSRDDSTITGLTTAATLLYSSGIGIATALHQYMLAVLLTIFILIVNYALHAVEKRFL